jgi:hypothetical protein
MVKYVCIRCVQTNLSKNKERGFYMKNNISKLIAILVLLSLCLSTLSPSVAQAWESGVNDPGNHQSISDFAVETSSFTADEKRIIKLGAVVADGDFTFNDGYPSLHGFINYIDAFTYLSGIADTITTTTTFTGWSFSDRKDNVKRQIDSALKIISSNWSYRLEGKPVTNRNVRLFVLGMTLHLASDTYAHRAVVNVPGKGWTAVTHTQTAENKDYFKYISCDDMTATPNRHELAKWVCRYTVEKWVNGTVRNYLLFKFFRDDFRLDLLYTYSGNKSELLSMSIND